MQVGLLEAKSDTQTRVKYHGTFPYSMACVVYKNERMIISFNDSEICFWQNMECVVLTYLNKIGVL